MEIKDYKQELQEMKDKQSIEIRNLYDYMSHINDCDVELLPTMGFRLGREAALAKAFRDGKAKIEKSAREFVKKFPDEK